MKKNVVITDFGFPDVSVEESMLADIDCDVVAAHCTNEDEVLKLSEMADAILVQWAPVTKKVIDNLKKCKIIVRYGIGVDNVDLNAAKEKGIPVCNVPDYCIGEVADHSVALAIALGRQLMTTDRLVRSGIWKITPPLAMPPFREMVFATMGYGRIATEVLKRAGVFGFRTAFYDPFISPEGVQNNDLRFLTQTQLFEQADIISLHLPLNKDTYHMINEKTLQMMKPGAILVNTARGGLADAAALAVALKQGRIGGAGLDVFEQEPLPVQHPLMQCENVILTSHTAWYSSLSVPALQRMATEEVVRCFTGQPLKSRVA